MFARNACFSRFLQGNGSAQHFLDRSVSGRLCRVKGQGFECQRAEATAQWVLKFLEVKPATWRRNCNSEFASGRVQDLLLSYDQ